jgi:hypothetical protein
MRRLLPLGAAALVMASAAQAQTTPGKYGVGAHIGYTSFDKGTGLANAPFFGVDGAYQTPWNPLKKIGLGNTDFSIGFMFAASRPLTRDDQFPVVALDYGDTTFLYTVAQRITLLQSGVTAGAGLHATDKIRIYAFGGVGAYTMFLDTRQNLKNQSFNHQMELLGGGVDYALSQSIGVRFELRAAIFSGYDRNRLDPTVGYARDQRIRDELPPPDPASVRPWNPQMSIVFQYVPSRSGGTEGNRQ